MKDYTHDVCGFCYAMMLGVKLINYTNPRTNKTTLERPLHYFTTYESGVLKKKETPDEHVKYFVADPEKFNLDNIDEDPILKTFEDEFHLVSPTTFFIPLPSFSQNLFFCSSFSSLFLKYRMFSWVAVMKPSSVVKIASRV
jgi:hypothetical protein